MGGLGLHLEEALFLVVVVSGPALLVGAVVGLFVAVFQAASQLQDPTIAHVPRLVAVLLALGVSGGWMATHIAEFARRTFLLVRGI